jgi:hypothetical protein
MSDAARLRDRTIVIDEGEAGEDNSDYDLLQALDAARTSDRKLFPEALKVIS